MNHRARREVTGTGLRRAKKRNPVKGSTKGGEAEAAQKRNFTPAATELLVVLDPSK